MRKFLAMLLVVVALTLTAFAAEPQESIVTKPVQWNNNTDYMGLIVTVLNECGDDGLDVAAILEQKRNQKIIDTNANVDCTEWFSGRKSAEEVLRDIKAYQLRRCKNYTYADVDLLAHVIYMEAGADWLSDEWKMCVGEVVMNRVLSDVWPNTIHDVVYQAGQYDRTWVYPTQVPSEMCYAVARRLLNGERIMKPEVVFQAGFMQGSRVYKTFYDSVFGYTYFCIP